MITRVVPLDAFLEFQAAGFLLVLTRIGGLLTFGPIFSSQTLSRTFRFYLAFALAILTVGVAPSFQVEPKTFIDLILMVLGELLVGFTLGSLVQMTFQALQLAGQTVDNQLGTSLANVINPQFDEQISPTSLIYAAIAALIFLYSGGDREMLAAMLETFAVIPPGGVFASGVEAVGPMALVVFQQSMKFAVRVAAPVTVALMLAEIAMGLVGRTVPQLNVQSVGFSVRLLLGMLITGVSLVGMSLVFTEEIHGALSSGFRALAEYIPPTE